MLERELDELSLDAGADTASTRSGKREEVKLGGAAKASYA
jgi:hypothetical protein